MKIAHRNYLIIGLLLSIQIIFVRGFVWHTASILATGANLFFVYRLLKNETKPRGEKISKHVIFLGLCILLSVALAFHFFQIKTMPHDLYGFDAARDVNQVKQVAENRTVYILFQNFSKEPLYYHLAALIYPLTHDAFLALKIVGALAGVAGSILMFYWALKEFQHVFVALVTGLLFAMSSWQLLMERYVVRPSLIPLVVIPLGYFLLKAIRYKREKDFFWVGIFTAAGFYIYTTYSIVPVIVGIFLAAYALRYKSRHALITFAVTFIFLAPMLSFIAQKPDVYFQRMLQRREEVQAARLTFTDQLSSFGKNYQHSVQGLFVKGATFPTMENTSPGQKAFDTITMLLILAGMFTGLWGISKLRNALSFLFIAMALIPTSSMSIGFDIETPNFQRMIIAFPFLMLFAGNAISVIYNGVKPKFIIAALLMVALTLSAQANFKRMFVDYPNNYPFDNLPVFTAMQFEHNKDIESAVLVLFYIDPEVVNIYMSDSRRVWYAPSSGVALYGSPAYFSEGATFAVEHPQTPLTLFYMKGEDTHTITEGRSCYEPYKLQSPYGMQVHVMRCSGKL